MANILWPGASVAQYVVVSGPLVKRNLHAIGARACSAGNGFFPRGKFQKHSEYAGQPAVTARKVSVPGACRSQREEAH